MKLRTMFRLGLAAGLLLAVSFSCRRSDMHAIEDQQLKLNSVRSSWIDDQAQADSASDERAVSRATEVTFQVGDQIGVFVHRSPSMASDGIQSSNMGYTLSSGGQWQPSVPMADPLSNELYWVSAYYPYSEGVTDIKKVEHTVELDQSAAQGVQATALERSDFCLTTSAAKLNDPTADSPKADLLFYHLMSKVRLDIDVPETIDGVKVSKLEKVTLCNLYVSCRINLEDQSIALMSQGNNKIVPRLAEGEGLPGAISTYEAIVVPQTLTPGLVFAEMQFVMEGGASKVLEYKIPDVQNFGLLKGQKTTLSLSATGQISFLNELDLLDGLAKNDLELQIKAPKGKPWVLNSSTAWLKLSLKPSIESGYTYGKAVSGTGTGTAQTLYVKVDANLQKNMAINNIRASILTLKSKINAVDQMVEYTATQNYATFEPITVDLPGAAGQHSEAGEVFLTNYYWQAQSDQDWLKFATQKEYGQGEPSEYYPAQNRGYVIGPLEAGKMWYQFAANPKATERQAKVTFRSYYDGDSKRLYKETIRTVIQRASALTGNNPANLPAVVGTTKVTFTTTPYLNWKIEGLPAWVTSCVPQSGVVGESGVVEAIITGMANGGSVPLKQNLTVTAGEMTLPLVLTQNGGDFNLEQKISTLMAYATSSLGFEVKNTLGGAWSIISIVDKATSLPATWLTATPMLGQGLGAAVGVPVTVTAVTNNTDVARVATVSVKAGETTLTLDFTQRAPALANFANTLKAYSSSAPASWSSGNMAVTPEAAPITRAAGDLQWKMSVSDAANLTASHTAVQNAAASNVTIKAEANNTDAARTLYYYLNYGALSSALRTQYSVAQGAPLFTLSGNKVVAPHITNDSFLVTTASNHEGVKYTLTKSADITTLSPTGTQTVAGTGNLSQTVALGFAQNTGAQRVHAVTVGYGASLSKVYSVTQQATSLTLGTYSVSIGADATSAATSVTSNVPYSTAVTSSYGGTVTPASGAVPPYSSLSTTLRDIPAQPDYPAVAKTHTVVFTPSPDYAGDSQVRKFTVTQAARPTSVSFSSNRNTYEASKQSFTIKITANTPWTINPITNCTVTGETSSTQKGLHTKTVTVSFPSYISNSQSTRTIEFWVRTTNDAGVADWNVPWYAYQKGSGTATTPISGVSTANLFFMYETTSGAYGSSNISGACVSPWRLLSDSEMTAIHGQTFASDITGNRFNYILITKRSNGSNGYLNGSGGIWSDNDWGPYRVKCVRVVQ